ncbi:MAG: DUF3800 domain-containing protein [Thermoleophilia bacterium]
MPVRVASEFSAEVGGLLAESSVSELKWKKLKSARDRMAAQKVLRAFCARADRGEVRADTLIWDFNDSRHAIRGRDDHENLGRIYYHLCMAVLRDRWPAGGIWSVYPDEFAQMAWDELAQILRHQGFKVGLQFGRILDAPANGFQVQEIKPLVSADEPLVQVADLFAGMAVYSRASYEKLEAWERDNGQMGLFDDGNPVTLNARDRERWVIIDELKRIADARKWGVSLSSTRGLESRDPTRGRANFWFYVPQHELDKAPVKLR